MKKQQLNEQRALAVRMLSTGHTLTAVAKACGVSRSTVYSWKETHSFAEELRRAIREVNAQRSESLESVVQDGLEAVRVGLRRATERMEAEDCDLDPRQLLDCAAVASRVLQAIAQVEHSIAEPEKKHPAPDPLARKYVDALLRQAGSREVPRDA